jgi:hypothetical protein
LLEGIMSIWINQITSYSNDKISKNTERKIYVQKPN